MSDVLTAINVCLAVISLGSAACAIRETRAAKGHAEWAREWVAEAKQWSADARRTTAEAEQKIALALLDLAEEWRLLGNSERAEEFKEAARMLIGEDQ